MWLGQVLSDIIAGYPAQSYGLVIISISLFFGSSCSQICDSYTVSVQNQYFETLYGVKIGEKSNEKVFEPGNYLFSTETASGLFLKTDISIKGNNRNIDLIVNEQGQLREK